MRRNWLWYLALLLPALTGCLSHTRKLQQPVMAGPALNADALQLVQGINERYNKIQSFTASIDFSVSVGGALQGKQTDYTSVSGYILFRKPQMLRVLILAPVLHSRVADLASNGSTFTLLIPPKDRAIEGNNTVTQRSATPLENLRPNVFVDSMLVPGISPDQIVSVIHENSDKFDPEVKRVVETPEYDLTVLTEAAPTSPEDVAKVAKALRVIRFSRLNLLPVEQDVYDQAGNLQTQVLYGPYKDFKGANFPSTIDVSRPIDGYRIKMTVENITNLPLSDEQFQIKIPRDYKVQKLE